jgi:hypothetical protein
MWFGILVIILFFGVTRYASASTNISATTNQHWAWNDAIGWIDFYNTGNITVSASQLTGYASSSVGYVSLDCGTAPGWGCSPANYKVTNDGAGNLGGWAWNDEVGWITFFWGDATADHSATSTYTSVCTGYGGTYCGVQILSDGSFHGYAWNDAIGYISFNCAEPGVCTPFQYSVVSSWAPTFAVGTLDSTTFDTGVSGGVELNSAIWHGSLNGLLPNSVGFQFAASTSTSSSWIFTGPLGTTSTNDIYYNAGPDTPIPITNYSAYAGFRYFRYRIILKTNSSQSISPQVTGVSVDWSP